MNEELKNFIHDLVLLIQEKYDQAIDDKEMKSSSDIHSFCEGKLYAYYDVLDLIESQLTAFGYNDAVIMIKTKLGKKTKE